MRHSPARSETTPPWYFRLSLRSKFVLIFYLVTLTFLAVIGHYGYHNAATAFRGKAMERVQGQMYRVSSQIGDKLHSARSTLHYFSDHFSLKHLLYWQDMEDKKRQDQWRVVTRNEWLGFVNNADIYYKVSYISNDGQERLTIRRDPLSREVSAVAERELQDWSGDVHVQAGLSQEGRSHMVSRMDLSREQGRLQKPLLPVLRFTQPVFGDNRVKYGVVMVTLFAETLFDTLREANKNNEKSEYFLLDVNGFYLFHPDPEKRFGQILGHGENIGNRYPGLVQRLQAHPEGTFSEMGHVIGYKRIFPQPGDLNRYWIVLSVTPEKEILAELDHFRLLFFSLVIVLLLVVFGVVQRYIDSLMKPLAQVTQQLQRLSQGQVERVTLLYRPQDEIRTMLDSLERMMGNLQLLVNHADTIARGDLTREAPLLSEHDRLGQALNNMTSILRSSRQSEQQQLWLKDGIALLHQALSSELSPAEMGERALHWIARYLAAGRGALYAYDAEQGRLNWLAGFMLNAQTVVNSVIPLGMGAVGQVALERKPLLLSWPEERVHPELRSATELRPARYTFTWPLLREGELLGVMELNSLLPLAEIHREFLESATQVTAYFLYIALQRERIHNLLRLAEQARQEALQQSAHLELANARLQMQQQQLQQQTEELQRTNTHMEEQQQQLQQQTEELQQTNSQMEEQQQMLQQQSVVLQSQNEELQRSQQELDLRAGLLEETNRYKSEFLANMSHELRTPLNSIILLAKMLMSNEQQELSESSIRQARVIHDAGNELLRLINDILDLSKIEAGRMELLWTTVASRSLLEEWQELFAAMAREKGLQLRMEDRWQGELYTDQHKLSQVMRNLLANAIKFTHRGQVELLIAAVPEEAGWLSFSVRDSGIGIAPEQQQRIFDAFQQVDGSISRQYGGTGLGLSICRRLVALLGGRIELVSAVDKGSTFTVLLPLSAPPEAEGERAKESLPLSHQESLRCRDDRDSLQRHEHPILIVDDDPIYCEALLLRTHHLGYKVLLAGNAAEALALAQEYRPAGILLDLGLPDQNGLALLHQLKATRELNAIPVYIVTGKIDPFSWQEEGALGLLHKPVSTENLAEVIENFRRLQSQPSRVLLVGGSTECRDCALGLLDRQGIDVVMVQGIEAALEVLQQAAGRPFNVVVSDFRLLGEETAIDLFALLDQHHPLVPVVVCSNSALNPEEEQAVRAYTDAIIQRSPQADVRLLADVERFLRQIRTPVQKMGEWARDGAAGVIPLLAGRTILVVDDDPRNLYVTTSALEQQGATVLQAMNGRKALEWLARQQVHLVLMDIMMPEMSGYETIEAIRAQQQFQHLPIIALTAKAMKEDREKCLAVGADDYLAKPVDYEMLVNMVRIRSDPLS
ncbi:response regulator [Candidatus Magnetaquicoccus inordinatus]|uniref:response regulator n=1 Tax=Candidatus Magnetaquicoccus inordinatus TaxID=2496818 RepID=UPI00102AC70B|nr:response regulator [Candidatus Magnetaquicoccus inordinatus]